MKYLLICALTTLWSLYAYTKTGSYDTYLASIVVILAVGFDDIVTELRELNKRGDNR